MRAMALTSRYPDGSAFRLRSRIAEFHGVSPDEVVHGNGSSEVIELLVRTFLESHHHMVFGVPAFSMYPVVAQAHNVAFTAVPTDGDLTHDLGGFLRAIQSNTRLILLDNPNNPTGSILPKSQLLEFLGQVPHHVVVALDEAYFEFADRGDYPNGLTLRSAHPRLFVLRTFSKAYGISGLRVGYGIGPKDLVGYLHRVRPPFNVTLPSQEAAIAALSDRAHLELTVSNNTTERARLEREMTSLARRVYPSQANFILADFGRPSAELYEVLLDRGVIVRPIPGLTTHLRVTVGTPRENDRFLSALREVLQ